MQSALHTASTDFAAPHDYAPFAQLARMLVPSAGSFAIYDAAGELAWSSDGCERPDVRALVEGLAEAGARRQPAIAPTAAGVPAFVAPLTDSAGEALGCVVLELDGNQPLRQTSSMIASLLRPVLECLEGRLGLERTIAGERPGSAREAGLSVEDAERRDAGALERLLRQAVQTLGSDQGALLVPDRGIRLLCATGQSRGAAARTLDATERHLLAWMQLNDRPLTINRAAANAHADPRKILAHPLRDAERRMVGLLAVFRPPAAADFTPADLKVLEAAAERAAVVLDSEHDPLTGFVNRLIFEQRVQRALSSGQGAHALLYLDVDRLQLVNDAFGYQTGDAVIQRVAAALRPEAGTGVVPSRVGGDRFALFLPDTDAAAAAARARELVAALAAGGSVDGAESVPLSVCIGVADTSQGQRRAAHLLAAAELACKRAKRFGRGRVQRAGDGDPLADAHKERALAAASLHEALRNGDLHLLAQPIVPLAAGSAAPVGYEVLLRMRGRDGDLLEPAKFFDAAERHHLLGALDRWVLGALGERAAPYAAALADRGMRLRLNVSAHSLADPEFAALALEQLERAGLPPSVLCFEVREALAVSRRRETEAFVAALTAAGCTVVLDNCGTGFGALGELPPLAVSELKIDGSFVRRIETDPVAESIVASLAQAARALGVRTAAQHVESAAVAERLRALGIDYGQGYHLGRPMPLAEQLAELGDRRAESVA